MARKGAPKPGAVVQIIDAEGRVQEYPSFVCKHCGNVVCAGPRRKLEDISGTCGNCWGLICASCVDLGRCTPFERKIERMEERGRMLREMGLA